VSPQARKRNAEWSTKFSAGIAKRITSVRRLHRLGSGSRSTTTLEEHRQLLWVITSGTRHTLDFSSSLIIARENDTFKRRIREAIEIHRHIPTIGSLSNHGGNAKENVTLKMTSKYIKILRDSFNSFNLSNVAEQSGS